MATEDGAGQAGRRRHKRGEGDKLRALIIDAAVQILEETGRESSVTIRGVTRRAGLAPQSFYLQFASLSELLFALYATGFQRLQATLISAADGAPDPRGRLEALCVGYLGFAAAHPGIYRTLTGTVGEVHGDWNPDELPGAGYIALLRDAILALDPELASDPPALRLRTALMMTQLHGIASLRANRPTFPWPPAEVMIEQVVGDSF